jgi:hypothetical protein
MQGRQFFFCAEERRTMALMLEGDRFGVQRGDEPSQKRAEFEIEYDLCVIGLGAIAKGIKKPEIETVGREK